MPLMVEEHSLMATQALECLQLYWLGVGDTYSGNLCLGEPFLPFFDQHRACWNFQVGKVILTQSRTGLQFLQSPWI
jgi:hypothetical protein